MVEMNDTKRKQFFQILREQKLHSVYQPIVSLSDGSILGYEALSRIDLPDCCFNVEELFQIAEQEGKLWELEAVCRGKSLQNALMKPDTTKLFLNVDPKIIHDSQFRAGMTCEFLQKYHLKPEDIIFEITERSSIRDPLTFQETIEHYRKQHFQIAIDDFGEGYAGLNRICTLSPEFLKIDLSIIRNIDKDEMKQSLVESFVHFCKSSSIKLIAEGIETEAELETLIRLGVSHGQGYLIQHPLPEMHDIPASVKQCIRSIHLRYNKFSYQPSFFGKIGTIAQPGKTVHIKESAKDIFEYFENDIEATEVSVVDDEGAVKGILTRNYVLELFGGRFGYNLHARKTVEEIMETNAMVVDENTSIEIVSKMALSRPSNYLYDAVIVISEGKYLGVSTVKKLLETAITIQVSKAIDASPLTGLPGNSVIQEEIESTMQKKQHYSIIYMDLDNFKAYNDAYGFHNGDLMIKTLAGCIQEFCTKGEFIGHIGGDDFVVITDYCNIESLCQSIMDNFHTSIRSLYSNDDWVNGYIISKNRSGFTEKFPMASVSTAALTNRKFNFQSFDAFSKELAKAKKNAKQIAGNSLICV